MGSISSPPFLASTKQDYGTLQKHRKDAPSQTPPALRLPTDVLVSILDLAHDVFVETKDGDPDPATVVGPEAIPFVASHVCSTWRAVAIDNKLLWTSIHIIPPWSPQLVDLWHKRSHPCPIHLRLSADEGLGPSESSSAKYEVWEKGCKRSVAAFGAFANKFLAPNLARYHTIFVQIGDGIFSPMGPIVLSKFGAMRGALPLLKTLSVDIMDYSKHYDRKIPQIFSGSTPALVDVRMGTPFFVSTETHHRLTQLHLSLSNIHVDDFHCTISECLVLETLGLNFSLRFGEPGQKKAYELPLFRLPHLSSLRLIYMGSTSSFGLLRLFSDCPACREIVVAPLDENRVSPWNNHEIIGPLQEGFKALDSLVIVPMTGSVKNKAMEMAGLHWCFPNLIKLTIVGPGSSFAALARDDGTPYWHNLRTLGVQHVPSGRALLPMLIARQEAGAPLRTLKVDKEFSECLGPWEDEVEEDDDDGDYEDVDEVEVVMSLKELMELVEVVVDNEWERLWSSSGFSTFPVSESRAFLKEVEYYL